MHRLATLLAALLLLACGPDVEAPPPAPVDPRSKHRDPACDWDCGDPPVETALDLRCVCPIRGADGACAVEVAEHGEECWGLGDPYFCHAQDAGLPRCLPLQPNGR